MEHIDLIVFATGPAAVLASARSPAGAVFALEPLPRDVLAIPRADGPGLARFEVSLR